MEALVLHCEKDNLPNVGQGLVASGTKQLKVVMALFGDARIRQVSSGPLMARSAEVLRKSVQPNLSPFATEIDRGIVLALDTDGPVF